MTTLKITVKITVKIPRKQGELIPFNVELWNTGEYEAVNKDKRVVRVLYTDNGGDYPIVVAYGNRNKRIYGLLSTYTTDGRYLMSSEPSLFLRKKSGGGLPKDVYMNIYPSYSSGVYSSLEVASKNVNNDHITLLHITYAWED